MPENPIILNMARYNVSACLLETHIKVSKQKSLVPHLPIFMNVVKDCSAGLVLFEFPDFTLRPFHHGTRPLSLFDSEKGKSLE